MTSAEGEKRGLDAPDAWVRYMNLKKYIDTWREGVHDLLTQHVDIFKFFERPPLIFPLKIRIRYVRFCPHAVCTAQLLSRLLDALRLALPRFPDAPALTALLSSRSSRTVLRHFVRIARVRLSHAASAAVRKRGARTRVGRVLQGGGVRAYSRDGLSCSWSTA